MLIETVGKQFLPGCRNFFLLLYNIFRHFEFRYFKSIFINQ